MEQKNYQFKYVVLILKNTKAFVEFIHKKIHPFVTGGFWCSF